MAMTAAICSAYLGNLKAKGWSREESNTVMISACRSEEEKLLFISSHADIQNAVFQQSVFLAATVWLFFEK